MQLQQHQVCVNFLYINHNFHHAFQQNKNLELN